jgi:hypothetical protein
MTANERNAESTSKNHFAEVKTGDPLYRDLQLRGYNRRLSARRWDDIVSRFAAREPMR